MTNLLFGVKPTDPLTILAVAILRYGIALAACLVPACRAMRVDPTVALRYECAPEIDQTAVWRGGDHGIIVVCAAFSFGSTLQFISPCTATACANTVQAGSTWSACFLERWALLSG